MYLIPLLCVFLTGNSNRDENQHCRGGRYFYFILRILKDLARKFNCRIIKCLHRKPTLDRYERPQLTTAAEAISSGTLPDS